MIVSKAAKRYARAFFQIAQGKNCLDKVAGDFTALSDLIEKVEELRNFLKAPLISVDKRKAVIKAMFSGKVNELTLEFLNFLTKKNRLDITQDTISQFIELFDGLKNIQRVTVTTAFELDKSQIDSMSQRLKEKLNKNIVAEVKVEPSLIGGFKIKVGDQVHDLSVATQLNKLKKSIVKA